MLIIIQFVIVIKQALKDLRRKNETSIPLKITSNDHIKK